MNSEAEAFRVGLTESEAREEVEMSVVEIGWVRGDKRVEDWMSRGGRLMWSGCWTDKGTAIKLGSGATGTLLVWATDGGEIGRWPEAIAATPLTFATAMTRLRWRYIEAMSPEEEETPRAMWVRNAMNSSPSVPPASMEMGMKRELGPESETPWACFLVFSRAAFSAA